VFQFDISHTRYEQMVKDMASQLNVPIVDNRFTFPEEVADGYSMYLNLPNGLQVHIFDIKFNQDWRYARHKNETEFYTLRFDELVIPDSMIITIDDEKIRETNTSRNIAYLTSSLFDWSYMGTKGSHCKGVHILFDKEFLRKYLDLSKVEDVLTTYISLRVENFTIMPLDSKFKRWLDSIYETEPSNHMYMTIITNRIMLLGERFFTLIYEKMKNPAFRVPLSQEDIDRVMRVEHILTKDIFQPAPSIQQLAKMVAISESKLKKDFKVMYGTPIYEYYQRTRMQAAQDKLLTGRFSVKEVAMELGYSNLSNFTIAFKKEFGILPSQLLATL
jgi:AraC-like DNA-binding protein